MQKLIPVFNKIFHRRKAGLPPAQAYDLWSGAYDDQPQNLMLHLDAQLTSSFLQAVSLKGGRVIDIGCGTGRHWHAFYKAAPASLTGYDISAGMLDKLKEKFPEANTVLLTDGIDNPLAGIKADVLISTLTVAHIEKIEQWMSRWSDCLQEEGYFFITDFHPALLQAGGQRTFEHHGKRNTVTNYIHSIDTLVALAKRYQLLLVEKKELYINEAVKSWYEQQNALAVYNKHYGSPVIYSLLFSKHGIQ